MSAIENVKRHFKEQGRITIEVPEWGGDGNPLLIYSDPMTVADRNFAMTRAKGANLMILIYTIIRMAKDENGNPIFTLEHVPEFTKFADPNVVIRVGNEIMRLTGGDIFTDGDIDEIVKNL